METRTELKKDTDIGMKWIQNMCLNWNQLEWSLLVSVVPLT